MTLGIIFFFVNKRLQQSLGYSSPKAYIHGANLAATKFFIE
jgi:hypothetical protein